MLFIFQDTEHDVVWKWLEKAESILKTLKNLEYNGGVEFFIQIRSVYIYKIARF